MSRAPVAAGGPPLSRPRIESAEEFRQAFGVSRETTDKLAAYLALLRTWQKTINLVSPGSLDAAWARHFADSAQLFPLAPAAARHWVDLGSGAGFPGLVLALMLAEKRPDARMTLIESDRRKVAFLREAARVTGAPVDILCTRIEAASTHAKLPQVDALTARALAPLPRLLALLWPFWSEATVALLPKGRDVDAEMTEAIRQWDFTATLMPSITDANSRIVVLERLAAKLER